MEIINRSVSIINKDYEEALFKCERAGRTCYQSQSEVTIESAERFIRAIIKAGHHSVIEHHSITVKFITSRDISHQLVRHRLTSVSQMSQRYCDSSNLGVIKPLNIRDSESEEIWYNSCLEDEKTYRKLLEKGNKKEVARSVLPNSTATKLIITANIREWRHILALRTDETAQPDIRVLMNDLLVQLEETYPVFFENVRTIK